MKDKSFYIAKSIRNTASDILTRGFSLFFLLLIFFQLSGSLISGFANNEKQETHFISAVTVTETKENSVTAFPWYVVFDISLSNFENAEENDSEKYDGSDDLISLFLYSQRLYLQHNKNAKGALRNCAVLLQNRKVVPLFIAHHSWKSFLV